MALCRSFHSFWICVYLRRPHSHRKDMAVVSGARLPEAVMVAASEVARWWLFFDAIDGVVVPVAVEEKSSTDSSSARGIVARNRDERISSTTEVVGVVVDCLGLVDFAMVSNSFAFCLDVTLLRIHGWQRKSQMEIITGVMDVSLLFSKVLR